MKLGDYLKQYFWVYLLAASMMLSVPLGIDGAVAVFAEDTSASPVIVIDPGHGGMDGGAVSCTGAHESRLNLEIALRVNDLLSLLGHPTVMTRHDDSSLDTTGQSIAERKASDLKNRVQLVERTPGAILLSIHQNQFSDSRYDGAQVFYAPTDQSRNLAEAMQQAMIQTLNPDSHRSCKAADGVYLMHHITCPGILVECGFLSNPQEEAKLRSGDYQKKLACVIAGVMHGEISA